MREQILGDQRTYYSVVLEGLGLNLKVGVEKERYRVVGGEEVKTEIWERIWDSVKSVDTKDSFGTTSVTPRETILVKPECNNRVDYLRRLSSS